jgi:Leucine-rich repeat (LRR) protein
MKASGRIWFPLAAMLFVLHQCDKEPGPHDPVNIPDPQFLNALIVKGFDTNLDRKISYYEAEAIQYLNVNNLTIYDLTGIESMTNLKALYCYNNFLSALDVSRNIELETIDCAENFLEQLDFSFNPKLTFIDCSRNGLKKLDVSKNNRLGFLWCGANSLTSLDISNNPALGSEWDYTANEGECSDEINLSYMPSLQEVCVWTLPFPPADREICINTNGSPNIYFSTDCGQTD